MPACGASAAAPGPRRARYLIPRELPRRADLIAGLVTAAVLGHLLFAQLTLVFAVALYLIGRAVRWRWTWLTVPAGVVHAVRNVGSGNAAELATYVVEKGKPLLTLAE